MKISLKYLGLLLLGTLCGCQEHNDPTPETTEHPIVFNAYLKEGNRITPITRSLNGDLSQGYFLGGVLSENPYLTSNKEFFFGVGAPDREMRVDGTSKDPDAPKLLWKSDSKTYHTFYAYTANPAETPTGYGYGEVRKFTEYTDANKQGVCLLFRQPNDPTKQIDFLTADNSNIVVTNGAPSAVNLYFQHRLSKVSIKVFGTGGANLTNCQAKITYGTVAPYSGVGNSAYAGLFIVKDGSGAYELSSVARMNMHPRHSGTYNLGPQFTVSNTQASELDASNAGSLIFVPQSVGAGWATIEIEYSIDGSLSRFKAKLEMPEIGQLYPTKEYIFTLNLVERSSLLTVANVRLVDWVNQSAIIDNLPGDYSLSLSATKPTVAKIAKTGATYNINVTSNRAWQVDKVKDVTVNPTSGGKGITPVTISVTSNSTSTERSVYAVFNTVGAAESMVSSTWMGTQL